MPHLLPNSPACFSILPTGPTPLSSIVDHTSANQPRSEPVTLIGQLRAETREIHAELEATLDLERITRSPSDYAQILATFRDLLKPLEDLLSESPIKGDPKLDLANRLRRHRLLIDLSRFPAIKSRPLLPPWSSLDRAEATGVLYVLEGSTLGGQVISTALRNRLGIDETSGASYFHGYGPETATRWREFLAWANQSLPEHRYPKAAEAAQRTFEFFLNAFPR
ncbi:MAG: biliverdin-producing heme oxygenase [Chthoniobacterales bacterium]